MHNLEFANFKFEGSREARKCLYLWGALHKGWGGMNSLRKGCPICHPFQFEMQHFICDTLILVFIFSDFNWIRKFFLHSILISHFAFKIFWFFFLANRETHTWSKYTNFNPKSLKLCKSVNLKGKVPLWE